MLRRYNSISLFLLLIAFLLPAFAKATVVVDAVSDSPLPKASIFDNRGAFIGTTSDYGTLPRILPEAYPISIRVVGYETATRENPSTEPIRLTKMDFELPEVLIESKKRQVLHIVGYLREYSTAASYSDTVLLFREKTVDFMIPAKKLTNYKGWTQPRMLASRSFYRFSDSSGRDSVSDQFRQHFSWSDWVGIFNSKRIPDSMYGKNSANETVMGKYSPSLIWNRIDDRITLDVNILADKSNVDWMPSLFTQFSNQVEFTTFSLKYTFTGVEPDDEEILADNIAAMSFNVESQGRGRDIQQVFHTSGPIYVNTYAELYIADKEYITLDEAKKWEKHPPRGEEIGILTAPDAPPLQASIVNLIERVGNIDHSAIRLAEETDALYRVKNIPDTPLTRRDKIKKVLKSIIH